MGTRRKSSVRFSSQNVRGLTDEKLEETVRNMQPHGVMARCLMETWREGDDVLDLHGFAVIQHGLPTRVCNRGSQGVAIVLSPEGRKAWEAAGCVIMHFGSRVLAVRPRETTLCRAGVGLRPGWCCPRARKGRLPGRAIAARIEDGTP